MDPNAADGNWESKTTGFMRQFKGENGLPTIKNKKTTPSVLETRILRLRNQPEETENLHLLVYWAGADVSVLA